MMNITKKNNSGLLLLCIAALSVPQQARTDDGWAGPIIAGSLIGAALGGLYYAFSESDEQVVGNAERDTNEVLRTYKNDVSEFLAFHNLSLYTLQHSNIIPAADEDNELYATAQNIASNGTTMRSYLSRLDSAIRTLRGHVPKVEGRKQGLERKYRNAQENQLLARMNRVYGDIRDAIIYLDCYYTFLSGHRSYFDLYEYEAELGKIYQQELAYGNMYQYDPLGLSAVLKQCIGLRYHSYSYPYIAYKDALDSHISQLQSCMRNMQRYPTRYGWATRLEQYLIRIRAIIVADSAYEREKEMRRIERQNQQQQQLMQQQLMQQQQMLATQQAHVRAMEEKNRIERVKNNQQAPVATASYTITVGI